MATVINNARTPMVERHEVVESSRSGAGFVLGVLAAIVLGILLLAYAIPALRSNRGTSVNIPDRVNLNVNSTPSGSTGTTAQ